MKVNITVSGMLRKPSEGSEFTMTLEKNKNIKDILAELCYKASEMEYIMCFLNDKPVPVSTVPNDRDNLFITVFAGGG